MTNVGAGTGASAQSGPHDVFISYARADVAAAVALQARLQAPPHNLKVWRDKTELLPGEHVDEAIPRALRGSKAVVVLWSTTSIASEWVRNEATYAYFAGKVATLALAGLDYGTLPVTYRPLNCGDYDAILADPAPLIARLAEIAAAHKPPPPARNDIAQLPRAPNAFIAREAELARLKRAWAEGEPKVLALIAAGGTGKTALAGAFLDQMAEDGWGGAEAVYAFSFDSQGTDEKRQGSSDRFFSEALTFFGADPTKYDSARKRARALADILETERALLVLDGIEPMQTPRGDAEHGRIRDEAMRDFLMDVARTGKGLCLVTTRLPLPDLKAFKRQQAEQISLPNLPLSDAVALLRSFKIQCPQEELAKLAKEYGQVVREPGETAADDGKTRCHAKAIALIGSFIAQKFPGATHTPTVEELHKAFAMPDEAFLAPASEHKDLKEEPGYAVYRMVRRYEIMYEDRAKGSKKALAESAAGRQLLLLRIMGLFDRPGPWGAFKAVLAAPELPGLTDGLGAVTPGMWQEAVAALRADGLLNPAPDNQTVLDDDTLLDAHPLIREYFGRRLKVVARGAFAALRLLPLSGPAHCVPGAGGVWGARNGRGISRV